METTSIWLNTLRDRTGLKVLQEGMPILLDIYDKYEIKSTFFFTGYIAQLYPELVKMVVKAGHEIGSHGKSHLPKNAFDVMPLNKQKEHLDYTKKLLEDISGHEIITFRAPALRVNKDTISALIETGHKIDSSVASQRFDFFLSFGSINKLKWFTAPRHPYHVSKDNFFKRGNSPLIEVPLTALFFPYVSTTMRLFPLLTSVQKRIFHIETILNNRPVVFDIHPNEFIDESEEVRIIHKRSNNFLIYLFKDLIRSQLKVKNLGKKAVPLYDDLINYYVNNLYAFTTIKDYCKTKGLI